MDCDHVLLFAHGLSGHKFALLEHNTCVSKDKVNSTGNEGVTVKLSVGVCVEGVLKCVNFTTVDDRLISTYAESNRLVLFWACRVLEPYVLSYKLISNSSCKTKLNIHKLVVTKILKW